MGLEAEEDEDAATRNLSLCRQRKMIKDKSYGAQFEDFRGKTSIPAPSAFVFRFCLYTAVFVPITLFVTKISFVLPRGHTELDEWKNGKGRARRETGSRC